MTVEELFRLVSVVVLFATLTASATTDVLHHKIYNVVTYPAIVLGLALGFGQGGLGATVWAPGLSSHALGFGLGFGLLFVVWWSRAVGGGEVKLAAAIGALGGFPFVVHALFWSSLVGAIMAIWVLLSRGRLAAGLRRAIRYGLSFRAEIPDPEDPASAKIPYGVAMAFGTMFTWFLLLPKGAP